MILSSLAQLVRVPNLGINQKGAWLSPRGNLMIFFSLAQLVRVPNLGINQRVLGSSPRGKF
jgi:hypothetical protein